MDNEKFKRNMLKDNRDYSHDIVLECVSIEQLKEMFDYAETLTISKFKAIVNKFAQGKDFSNWKERIDFIKNDPKPLARTKEKTIIYYGKKLGNEKWDAYCNRQSETNTFEYKQKTYGMTKEEFEQYNKSRSHTLENMISRYGEIEGKKRFDEYCQKQKDSGCSKEHFIKKYGEEKGIQEYERVCLLKTNSLEAYVMKYGKTEGKKKYLEFREKRYAKN